MSRSILFYRQELNWLGGIGVIVLAVALLPMLGIGGMQLYKAEMAGPLKDERFTPRLARTARSLCVVYIVLTVVCAVALLARGHEPFDADQPQLLDARDGGLVDARRQHGLLRQRADRGRRDRVHADRRHQLQRALHRVAHAAARSATARTRKRACS